MKLRCIKTKVISVSIVWILVCSSLVVFMNMNISQEAAGADIWIVDQAGGGNFTTIQDAINNSNDGDTIYVWAGTYLENVVVNKTVSLVGNGSSDTIINGTDFDIGVDVVSDWVNISGFKVTNAYFGVKINGVSNVTVEDCEIVECVFNIDITPSETSLFKDDFSTDKGWTGYGGNAQWERGAAMAGGGDPSMDHSPSSDNMLIGNNIGGGYANDLGAAHWLTSPVIDCSGFSSVRFSFWRWLGLQEKTYDDAFIQVYNGMAWVNIWQNDYQNIVDYSWKYIEFDVSAYAANNPNFQVRFGLGATDYSISFCGWNLDDVLICGFSEAIIPRDNTIFNNTCKFGVNGIYVYKSDYNYIMNNTIQYNTNGIHLSNCTNNTISTNNITLNFNNMYLDKADYNMIEDNHIYGTPQMDQISQTGLRGRWSMDELSWNGSSEEVKDDSGNANHGTAKNGANTAPGLFARAGYFYPGANKYIEVPDATSLDITGDITLSAWIYIDREMFSPYFLTIYSKGDAYNLMIRRDTNEAQMDVKIGGVWSARASSSIVPLKVWTHIAGTYSVSTGEIRIFVNGVEENGSNANNPKLGGIDTTDHPLWIGANPTISNRYFHGYIDEIFVYDRLLSTDELDYLSHYSKHGMEFINSNNNTISGNTIALNNNNVYLKSSRSNKFDNNNISILKGQYGFYFNDEWSFDNNINTSNEVNDITVKWYTHATNLSLEGLNVDLIGITNIAQIMLYDCDNAIITNSTFINGINVGIYFYSSRNNAISGNEISSNTNDGIEFRNSNGNTISNNNITSNGKYGMEFFTSSGNTIFGNDITSNNHDGIRFITSSGNTISGNNLSDSNYGIAFHSSSNNNTILNNDISNNNIGIAIWDSSDNVIFDNDITSNNNEAIRFTTSSSNTISGNNITNNNYGIEFWSSSNNNTISGNIITQNNNNGIDMHSSVDNIISDNNITLNNYHGIYFSASISNTIFSNNITSNNQRGILFKDSSNSNTISDNMITSNGVYGIEFMSSNSNTISRNNFTLNSNDCIRFVGSTSNIISTNIVTNSHFGITLWSGSNGNTISDNNITSNSDYGCYVSGGSINNVIYHNQFIGNTIQAYDDSTNSWNMPYPGGGNYWDDWTLPNDDGDRWVDIPRPIADGGSQDLLPWAEPYGWTLPSAKPVMNLDTGENFTTIQEAIDDADTLNGHTIWVPSGVYYENPVVNKTLNLTGEDRETTVIDGGGLGDVVTVESDWVNITGFKIINGEVGGNYAGIYIKGMANCRIDNNIISNNNHGIYLKSSNSNTIFDNNISLNNLRGILLTLSSNSNMIYDNEITSNGLYGIEQEFSSGSIISGNGITSNNNDGIRFVCSNGSTISDNILTNSNYGMAFWSSSNNTVSNNSITWNSNYGFFLSGAHNKNNEIYHNNFIENAINALDDGTNSWNLPYPQGGNFW
ncbi:MAG: right-handed parallel beta-helix repeat-containing protein, partial [Thermoplasmata archaeon]